MIDKSKLFVIVIVSLLSLAIIANIFQYCQEPKTKIVSVKETVDTTKIKQQFKAELETELRATLKPVIKKVQQKVNIDSLQQVAYEYWKKKIQELNPDVPIPPKVLGQYDYYAYGDTTLNTNDSTAYFEASYYSRIPLDPEGKLSIRALWYNRNITHTIETTVTEQKSFFQLLFGRFHWSIQSGVGIDLITQKPVVYGGVGISFNIGSIF